MAHEVKSLKEFISKCVSGNKDKVVKIAYVEKMNQKKSSYYKMKVKTTSGVYTFVAEDNEKAKKLIENLKSRCKVEMLGKVIKQRVKQKQL